MTESTDKTVFDAYTMPAGGDTTRREACGATISLASDGKSFLVVPSTGAIDRVDVATGRTSPFLRSSRFAWVSFLVTRGVGVVDIVAAPVPASGPVRDADWIVITDHPGDFFQAFWAPSGSLLYYVATSAARSG